MVAIPRAVPVDAGFDESYRRLFLGSMRLAARLTGSTAAGEEIAAEALVRAYVHWRRIHDLQYLDAWVQRVTVNLCIDEARRRRSASDVLRRLTGELVSRGRRRPAVCDEVELHDDLVVALRQLPRRQREAVALRYLGGLDDDDVAAAMGVSESTFRTHVQRGLHPLRGILTEEIPEALDV